MAGTTVHGQPLPRQVWDSDILDLRPLIETEQTIKSIKFNRSLKRFKNSVAGRVSATGRYKPIDGVERTYNIYRSGILTSLMNRGIIPNTTMTPPPEDIMKKAEKAADREVKRQLKKSKGGIAIDFKRWRK